MSSLYLLIRIDGNNVLLDKFIRDTGQMINLRVFNFHDITRYQAMIEQIVDQDDCKWLSTVYIDADDGFLDGYFDYVSSELTGKLVNTLTMDGLPWRGAVFGPRSMSRLIIGKGRCATKKIEYHYYSGFSQGQGFILRRDVWEKIGRRGKMRQKHIKFLSDMRNFIMRWLGFREYQSQCCDNYNVLWKQSDEQIALENKDAASSRILYIDVSLEMKTAAIFVVTPFSSHFPWESWQDLPACRDEGKKFVQRQFPKDINYILDIVDSVYLNITFEEACQQNIYVHFSHDCSKVPQSGAGVRLHEERLKA